MILRPYQTALLDEARALMRSGRRSILLTAPTGSGKTLLTAWMLKAAAANKKRSWFIVHRRELLAQSVQAFQAIGITPGVVQANWPTDNTPFIQVCMVQTLARRTMLPPSLIVWDEAHHAPAGSYARLRAAHPTAFHIGLTATPERLDGKGLRPYFDVLLSSPSVQQLTADGWLAPYRLYAPPGITTTGLHTRMGDYANDELTLAADRPTITGDAIAHYQRHAAGLRALVFCVSIQHSQHVAAQFNAAGIPAAHVDGETHHVQRDRTLKQFSDGTLKILCSVDLFGEGLDVPALESVILLRPTQSLALYLQQVGRALRPGKTAMILDHAGNCLRHGLPDDYRTWSLDGKAGRLAQNGHAPSVRVCGSCFAAQWPGNASCRFCGALWPLQPREVVQADGELARVDPQAFQRAKRRTQGQAQTYEELLALGRQRGYKNPAGWAWLIRRARFAKRQHTQARKLAGRSS